MMLRIRSFRRIKFTIFALFFCAILLIIFAIKSWQSMSSALNVEGLGLYDREIILRYFNHLKGGRRRDESKSNLAVAIELSRGYERPFSKQQIVNLLGVPDAIISLRDLPQDCYFYYTPYTRDNRKEKSEKVYYRHDFTFNAKGQLVECGGNSAGEDEFRKMTNLDQSKFNIPMPTWTANRAETMIWNALSHVFPRKALISGR